MTVLTACVNSKMFMLLADDFIGDPEAFCASLAADHENRKTFSGTPEVPSNAAIVLADIVLPSGVDTEFAAHNLSATESADTPSKAIGELTDTLASW